MATALCSAHAARDAREDVTGAPAEAPSSRPSASGLACFHVQPAGAHTKPARRLSIHWRPLHAGADAPVRDDPGRTSRVRRRRWGRGPDGTSWWGGRVGGDLGVVVGESDGYRVGMVCWRGAARLWGSARSRAVKGDTDGTRPYKVVERRRNGACPSLHCLAGGRTGRALREDISTAVVVCITCARQPKRRSGLQASGRKHLQAEVAAAKRRLGRQDGALHRQAVQRGNFVGCSNVVSDSQSRGGDDTLIVTGSASHRAHLGVVGKCSVLTRATGRSKLYSRQWVAEANGMPS
ncbi:hypothetical protein PsYK624_066070 [Phanerochaete sordida]|uniref:Uncharacterized protein n=1 Tax=Phanerochaete sordida TaxID=48140 RepID=A0A9P3G8Y4_9APHY|nr:hypothetical protein PsYK624_066070 [Phanerochaete sordida]